MKTTLMAMLQVVAEGRDWRRMCCWFRLKLPLLTLEALLWEGGG